MNEYVTQKFEQLRCAQSLSELKQGIFNLAQSLGFDGIYITGLSQMGAGECYISNFPDELLPTNAATDTATKASVKVSKQQQIHHDMVEQCVIKNGSSQHSPIVWQASEIQNGVAIATYSNRGNGYVKFYCAGSQAQMLNLYQQRHLELVGIAQLIFQQLCHHFPEAIFNQPKLTDKGKECLHFMSKGLTNVEISKLMDVSKDRVKELVSSILLKLEAANRTEAVMIAAANNMLH